MKNIGQKIYTSWYGNMSNIYDRNRTLRKHACIRLAVVAALLFWVSYTYEDYTVWKFSDKFVPWATLLIVGYHWWVTFSDSRVVLKLSKPFRKRIWRPVYVIKPGDKLPAEKFGNYFNREKLLEFWNTLETPDPTLPWNKEDKHGE